MNELAFEVFVALTLLLAGLLTYAFKERRNPFVGFRIGYTYMSDKAWREANTFAGAFMTVFSLLLLGLALAGVGILAFTIIMLVGLIFLIIAGFRIAKRAYEEEELSTEAQEKPVERIEVNVKPYLTAQILGLVAYLTLAALFWDKLPERVAVHFNASGRPDGFAPKTLGLLFPLAVYPLFPIMTYLLKEPAFAPLFRFRKEGWRAFAEFMTVTALGLVFIDSLGLLYNATYVSSSWIGYSVWTFLAVTFVMVFRLLRVRREEG